MQIIYFRRLGQTVSTFSIKDEEAKVRVFTVVCVQHHLTRFLIVDSVLFLVKTKEQPVVENVLRSCS